MDLRDKIGGYLVIERTAIGFNPDSNLWIDVAEFERRLDCGLLPLQPTAIEAAVELYQGDFLQGFYVRDAVDFEDWAAAERERLRHRLIDALRALTQHHVDDGEPAQAIIQVRRLLALEPWLEEAHRQMMSLLARNGQRGAALTQFETCRAVLNGGVGR